MQLTTHSPLPPLLSPPQIADSPNSSSFISLAACMPSSLRLRSIRRLLAAAARSSADCAQPMVRIASTQNVLKVVWYRPNEWPNTLGGRRIETMEWINYLTRWPGHTQQLLPAQLSFLFSFAQNNWVFCFFLICFCFSFTVCLRIEKYFALLFHCGRSRER